MVSLISSERDRYVASLLETPEDIAAARKLHANVYQEKGWAGDIDLTDAGTLNDEYDPWHAFAVYFGVKDTRSPGAELVVAGRILDAGSQGAASLQTLAYCDLDDDVRKELETAEIGTVVELSGLAKAFDANPIATLNLYREMWGYSLRAGHRHWIMACDVSLRRKLERLLGNSIDVVGGTTVLQGSTVVPMHVRLPESLDRLLDPPAELSPRARERRLQLAEFFIEVSPIELLSAMGQDPERRRAARASVHPLAGTLGADPDADVVIDLRDPPIGPASPAPVGDAATEDTTDKGLDTTGAAPTPAAVTAPDAEPGTGANDGPVHLALWNAYSWVYDGLLAFWPYTNLLSTVIRRAELDGARRLLDTGCGTGNLLRQASTAHPELQATGVDSSRDMLKMARRKLGGGPVELVESDITPYLRTLDDASFDRIVSVNMVYALRDRAAYWHEVMRILEPGGRAVVTTSTRVGSVPIIREHLEHSSVRRLLTPRLIGVFVIDALINLIARGDSFHFVPEDQLVAEVESAGGRIRSTQRCYGGPERGVNTLLVIEHATEG